MANSIMFTEEYWEAKEENAAKALGIRTEEEIDKRRQRLRNTAINGPLLILVILVLALWVAWTHIDAAVGAANLPEAPTDPLPRVHAAALRAKQAVADA